MRRCDDPRTAWLGWAVRVLIVAGCGTLVSLLLVACAGNKTATTGAVRALSSVTPYARGKPALLFVYTDG